METKEIIKQRLAELQKTKNIEFKKYVNLEDEKEKEESFMKQDRMHQRIDELKKILKII